MLGTVLGTAAVALVAVAGAETGQPTMVLLRGLLGARLSWLPTVLNVVQLIGWTTFELVTISTAMHQITPGSPRWVYVIAGGRRSRRCSRCGRSAGSGCCAATSRCSS